MASMAKASIIGNVGRDPEQRYTPSGTMMVNFTVAVNNRRRQPDGSFTEETEWFRVVASGRLAEVCQQYVTKGSQLYVEGRLRADRWTGNDGQPRVTLEIFANDVQFVGSRQRDPEQSMADGYEPQAPAAPRAPAGGGRPTPLRQQQPDLDQSDLEDLPF